MDSAGRRRQRRRAELARAREQLVLPLQRRRDDVEEDVRAPHGLHEDVLGSGGDATQRTGGHAGGWTVDRNELRLHDKRWNYYYVLS